ncbi:TonB-dependent receptor [Marinifilum sp. D714]|uniref:SusC/RagA family TonB-linked outer membrane protein n=1 Tax=Marinifilum sp. D714 TaxID=2937523 RepID=UPI0027C77476|nr:TonB-dependent receptor [Marinifilum sp. D714]MDQ2178609.1 TonB-dependent receptor [Marinifilum sp. D714]
MKKMIGLFVYLFLIGVQIVNAQSKQITGTVTSAEDGLGMPGVSVVIKGTTIGASTDIDGKYTLKAEASDVLMFSFVGMVSQEVTVGNQTVINVVMENESIGVDEVMVVAYGTAKRSSFTGSATVVKADKLEKRKTTEITKALEGEVAGVQVINSSGQPGETAQIRIRGIGSLNASSEPLYVLDGIPFGGDLSSIDTRDIESFTVLKDASAAALYGSRAANGVVLIETKKGKQGKSKIDVNIDLGTSFRLLPYYETTDSPEEYYELSWEALRNAKLYAPAGALDLNAANAWASQNLVSELGGYNLYNVADDQLVGVDGVFNQSAQRMINDDWEDEMMRTGLRKSIGVSFRGGKDRTTYYSSVNYMNDEGYVKESSFDRLSSVINLDHQVKSWLKTSNKLSYTYSKMTNPVSEDSSAANNAFYFINNIPPIYPVFVYDEDYNRVFDENDDYLYDYSDGSAPGLERRFGNFINPARSYELDERFTEIHEVTANSYLEATFLDNFKFSTRIGVTYQSSLSARQQNSLYGDGKGKGSVSRTTNNRLTYTWNQILNWNKQFDDHTISAMVGHEVYDYERKYQYGYKTGTLKEHVPEFSNAIKLETLNSDTYSRSMESYFGQVIYDYKSKYFLKGSYRRDGSSRFPNDRWGDFWSIGGSWKASDEDFLADYSFIDLLKFKASYGVSGNENITSSYPAFDLYNIANLNDQMALEFDSKGNPNLTWESNTNFNVGVEFDLWNRKLSGSLEYYVRDTKDMLYSRDVAGSLGYSSIFVNDLDMRNSGFEFSFSYTPVSNDDHELTINLNGAHYKNEITKMPADPATGKPSEFIRNGTFGYEKGRSIYDRYLQRYAGVDSATGQAQWWVAVNEDGAIADINKSTEENLGDYTWEKTTDYDEATRVFTGNTAIPDLQGGFSFYYRYKGFDLDVRCIYQIGGKAYDGIYADLMNSARAVGKGVYHKDILNRWTPGNTTTDIPRLTNDLDKNISSRSDRWLTDASFLGLSNVRLGYTFSNEICDKLNVDALSVYASGNNLYTFTKRKGFYPNTSTTGSSDEYRYTPMSAVTLGVKVTF